MKIMRETRSRHSRSKRFLYHIPMLPEILPKMRASAFVDYLPGRAACGFHMGSWQSEVPISSWEICLCGGYADTVGKIRQRRTCTSGLNGPEIR